MVMQVAQIGNNNVQQGHSLWILHLEPQYFFSSTFCSISNFCTNMPKMQEKDGPLIPFALCVVVEGGFDNPKLYSVRWSWPSW